MGRNSKREIWHTIRIRDFLYLKIKENVSPNKETSNLNQFVQEAVKEKLQRMGGLK